MSNGPRLTEDEALKLLMRQYVEAHPEEFWDPHEPEPEPANGNGRGRGCLGCLVLLLAAIGALVVLAVAIMYLFGLK